MAWFKLNTTKCHKVLTSALSNAWANSDFLHQEFATDPSNILNKFACPTFVVVIDGCAIASRDLIEVSDPVQVILADFTCVMISFNMIGNSENLVNSLSWYTLLDWKNEQSRGLRKTVHKPLMHIGPDSGPHPILTISM